MGRFCEARRGQLNQTFRSLIIQSQNRLHVVELGHGVCSAGPRGRHGRDLAENRKSLSQKQAPISTLAVGPGREHAPACGMSFGIDPLLRRSVYTSTWTRSRLIGEARLLAMAIVDNSPYNHQPGVADPSRDLGSVGRRPLSETASPEPRPPPASHQPPSLQYLTPPSPQNHPIPQKPIHTSRQLSQPPATPAKQTTFHSRRPIGIPFPPARRARIKPGNSTYPPLW